MLKSTLNAWTPDNRNTDVPRAVYQDPNGNIERIMTDSLKTVILSVCVRHS